VNLRLYDSLSREVRPVEPVEPGRLSIYSCGPTVYSYIHVGNARPYVVAMTLRRHLARQGVDARAVINITDVNDKIYDAARAAGRPSEELAREFADAYVADTGRLGLGRPDHEPRVTDTVPEIVALIETLVERGLAYAAAGDVYFRVRAFEGYGALSGQRPDELLQEGGRLEPGEGKESPLDFALWKGNKPGEDTSWPSPWGPGRPGWHIECSAMAVRDLGPEFDVHGGGLDLIFPHHENERAQSTGAGHPFARTWLHNGMLEFAGDKMSKSVGNVERLRDALDARGPETLLVLFAQAHYRSPLEYSETTLSQAAASADRLREALQRARSAAGDDDAQVGAALARAADEAAARFDAALDDDLATPEGLAALFGLARELNAAVDAGAPRGDLDHALERLVSRLDVLGLAGLDAVADGPPAEVAALAEERDAARAARDFTRADALRDEIAALGWDVRDTPQGREFRRR
jgi:cysteinyl-tRNA synthetase